MTREEELLDRVEEQKKYIKLLEEQNEALQEKMGKAVKDLEQFRQVEQKKLDDALDDLDDLPDKKYYEKKKKSYNMFKAAAKEIDDEEKEELEIKVPLSDDELVDALNSIDIEEKL